MPKLWQVNQKKTHPLVEKYTSAEDLVWDQKLIPYDIYGSLAHAMMLEKIKVLSQPELKAIRAGLLQLLEKYEQGAFSLSPREEDCHTAIENKLVEISGTAGEKIHAGRSRNDQVLTALKLFTKANLIELAGLVLELAKALQVFAKKYEWTAMPGYTHMQQAMPSSVGLWASNFAWLLLDDLKLVEAVFELNDQNPLGSGAAYGVSLPVDREMTAKLLGFSKVQMNVLSTQNSRGKTKLAVLQALSQVMVTLSKLAQDVLLFTQHQLFQQKSGAGFTTSEFGFFEVDESLTTGSSIMPQKKNLDVMELVRAKTQTVLGLSAQVAGISAGLPSGYNRDLQETKSSLMKGFEVTKQSTQVCQLVVEGIKPNKAKLKAAMTPELFATHHTYQLVKKGMTFRAAYQKTKLNGKSFAKYKTQEVLKQMNQMGAPGNLGLGDLSKQTKAQNLLWAQQAKKFNHVIGKLTQIGGDNHAK